MAWEAVIGLEVHAQLATRTKIFARESTAYGAEPNTQVSEVCAGLPGVLPVLNRQVVEGAMKAGMALGCEVHRWSQFDRKNYFYPDLPKGYQISQFTHPICTGGEVVFRLGDGQMRCALTRIHLEEDAGKSTHTGRVSLVDLNRAGVPLIEIVSEPELRTAEQASAYLKELRNILRYIGVCDGNMEQGSFRCDANVSVRPEGQAEFGTRAEIKNLNSFRFVQKAIDYEIARQIDVIESGGKIIQETRLYNADTGRTTSMRSKEDAHDYRYFPDPDLPPLVIDEAWFEQVRGSLPELPGAKRARFQSELGLSAYDAGVLTQSRAVADFFDAALSGAPKHAKVVANWTTNNVLRIAQNPAEDLDDLKFGPDHLAQLVNMLASGDITGNIARQIFDLMAADGRTPSAIADEEGLRPQRDEGVLREALTRILDDNPSQVAAYRGGKKKLFGFFMGQVMRATRGEADPKMTQQMLRAMLEGEG